MPGRAVKRFAHFVRFENSAGFCQPMIRQGRCCLLPVWVLLQFVEFAEDERPGRAGGHTGRDAACLQLIPAEVTLAHPTAAYLILRCGVGAGPLTIPAAHAFGLVDRHDTVFILIHGRGGADLDTNRFGAMIAAHRYIPCLPL